jgi:hypothetical protein
MREAKRVLLIIKNTVMKGLNNIIVEDDSLNVVSIYHNLGLLLDWQLEHFIFKTN